MSYQTKYRLQHTTSTNGTENTHRVDILKKDYTGSITPIKGNYSDGVFSHIYEELDPKEPYNTPLQKSRLEVYLQVRGQGTDPQLGYDGNAILQEIFAADELEFKMIRYVNGDPVWHGYVLPDLLEYPDSEFTYSSKIVAKDLTALSGSNYPISVGRAKPIEIIAEILAELGYNLPIHTYTSWINENTVDTADFLDQIYVDKKAFREIGDGNNPDEELTNEEILEKILTNFSLILRQVDNAFKLYQFSALKDPTAVYEFIYDAAGAFVSSSVRNLTTTLNTQTFTVPQGNFQHSTAVKEVQTKFNHRAKVSGIQLPETIGLDSDASVTQQEFSQLFLSDGSQTLNLSGNVRAVVREGGGPNVNTNIRIKVGGGSSTSYWWNGTSWQTTTFTLEKDMILEGGELYYVNVSYTTTEIPADADGNIEISFIIADDPGGFSIAKTTEYRYFNFSVENSIAQNNSTSINYKLTQAGNYSKRAEYPETWLGDGPTAYSVSAIRFSPADGDTTTEDWQRRGDVANGYRNFHQNLLSELLDVQRSHYKIRQAVLIGGYSPGDLIVDSGMSMFFVGGDFTAADERTSGYFIDLQISSAVTDTFTDIIYSSEPGSGSTSTGGSTGGSTDVFWTEIIDKPVEFPPAPHPHAIISAGAGITMADYDGTAPRTITVTNPFDPSGTYSGLRAQATTKGDVGLSDVTNDLQVPAAGGTFTGDVSLSAGKWLKFVDKNNSFPSALGGFEWDLNNDKASIYAYQPASDDIDFVFKLEDNVSGEDRFVFWVDNYQGSAEDVYPLIMSGVGAAFGVDVDINEQLTVSKLATFGADVVLGNQASTTSHPVRADRSISAGNGLTGGGNLTSNRSITLGTPSSITVGGSNGVTGSSHTHTLDLSGRSLTLSNDSDGVLTWAQNAYNLGADRTWIPTISDHGSGQRGVVSIGSQTFYGSKTLNDNTIFNSKLSSPGAVSGISGWQGTAAGNWDFRSITADSLVVQAFTADVAQAFRGSTFLTKSFASIKASFTVPAVGSSTTVTVAEVEGFPGMDVFELNDYLLVQLVDQSGGGLLVGEVWGEVTSAITDNGDGTQSFTFTTRNLSVAGLAGNTLHEGNEMLSFGSAAAPKGFIHSTVLDNLGSPYSQVVTWDTTPWDRSNWTLRTRTGNLAGVANASGYGFYGENTFLTNSLLAGDLTKAGNYVEYKNGVLTLDGTLKVQGKNVASQEYADGAVSTFSSSLGSLAGRDNVDTAQIVNGAIETAKLGTTIITGGYIKTTLLDVDSIIASGSIVVTGSNISDLTNDSGFQTSTDVSTAITTFSGTLGGLAYDDLVEKAKLGTTIITGGFIDTSLINVDNIVASGSIVVSGDNVSDLTNDSGFQTSTQVSTAITNFSGTLGGLAYDDAVEKAKLGTTIVTGGFIKTSLLDVGSIVASGSIIVSGDNISALTNDSGFQTSSQVSTAITNFSNGLGNLAYDNLVEAAQLGNTIITGGLIKTSLLDVDNIFAQNAAISGILNVGSAAHILNGTNNTISLAGGFFTADASSVEIGSANDNRLTMNSAGLSLRTTNFTLEGEDSGVGRLRLDSFSRSLIASRYYAGSGYKSVVTVRDDPTIYAGEVENDVIDATLNRAFEFIYGSGTTNEDTEYYTVDTSDGAHYYIEAEIDTQSVVATAKWPSVFWVTVEISTDGGASYTKVAGTSLSSAEQADKDIKFINPFPGGPDTPLNEYNNGPLENNGHMVFKLPYRQDINRVKMHIITGYPGGTTSNDLTNITVYTKVKSTYSSTMFNSRGFRLLTAPQSYISTDGSEFEFSKQSVLFNHTDVSFVNGSSIRLGSFVRIYGDGRFQDDLHVSGNITKSTSNFKINHPNPAKGYKKDLYHSMVESPTAGDNIYRYSVTAAQDGEEIIIDLPDYYTFLNKDNSVWVNGVGHFGAGYGELIENNTKLKITCQKAGEYKILLIGTRKDKAANKYWKGVERDKIT